MFVENSGLPQEDKDFWLLILGKLDDFQVKVFEDFIDGKEENLKILTENIKSKQKAFETLDQKSLDKILEEEIKL